MIAVSYFVGSALVMSLICVALLPVSANGVLPVFGRLISGPVCWVGCVALGGVLGWLAWSLYRLQWTGWWVAVALDGLAAASSFFTFSRVDLLEMYGLMGYPKRQIEMMRQTGFAQGKWMAYLSIGSAVFLLGYFVFVSRYFRKQVAATPQA